MKYVKTEAGQLAFKSRSAVLTPRVRSAFILFDGNKTLEQVLEMTAGLGVARADIELLVSNGLLQATVQPAPSAPAADPVTLAPAEAPQEALTEAQRFALAWPIATQITASLGLRGLRLNLAVESAAGYVQLCALLPKIRDAVGEQKVLPLERALGR